MKSPKEGNDVWAQCEQEGREGPESNIWEAARTLEAYEQELTLRQARIRLNSRNLLPKEFIIIDGKEVPVYRLPVGSQSAGDSFTDPLGSKNHRKGTHFDLNEGARGDDELGLVEFGDREALKDWQAAEFLEEEEIDIDGARDEGVYEYGVEYDEYDEMDSPTMVHSGDVEPMNAPQRRGKVPLLSRLSHVEIPTYPEARVEAFWRALVRDLRERLNYAQALGQEAVAEEWKAIDLWAEKNRVRRMMRALLGGRTWRLSSYGVRDARGGRMEWREADEGVDERDEQVEAEYEVVMKNLAGEAYVDEGPFDYKIDAEHVATLSQDSCGDGSMSASDPSLLAGVGLKDEDEHVVSGILHPTSTTGSIHRSKWLRVQPNDDRRFAEVEREESADEGDGNNGGKHGNGFRPERKFRGGKKESWVRGEELGQN